jgi:hypothetical protein
MNLKPRLAHCLVLSLLTLSACSRVGTAEPRSLPAGAATNNFTPALGVSLEGVIAQGGRATHVHDELDARCLVLDDGRERIAERMNALLGADRHDPPFVGIMSNGTSGDVNAIDFSTPDTPARPTNA